MVPESKGTEGRNGEERRGGKVEVEAENIYSTKKNNHPKKASGKRKKRMWFTPQQTATIRDSYKHPLQQRSGPSFRRTRDGTPFDKTYNSFPFTQR